MHSQCVNCYRGYLIARMDTGMNCIKTQCPEEGCPIILPEEIFERLLSKDKFKLYQMHLIRSYVDWNRDNHKWCPGKDCEMAVHKTSMSEERVNVDCSSCHKAFCFDCGRQNHEPVDCSVIEQWELRTGNKEEDAEKWIKFNTKPCPKCKTPVAKDKGCMHMECPTCKYEWCWMCLGSYANHEKETGLFLCSTVENVKNIGRYVNKDEKFITEAREMALVDHYTKMF